MTATMLFSHSVSGFSVYMTDAMAVALGGVDSRVQFEAGQADGPGGPHLTISLRRVPPSAVVGKGPSVCRSGLAGCLPLRVQFRPRHVRGLNPGMTLPPIRMMEVDAMPLSRTPGTQDAWDLHLRTVPIPPHTVVSKLQDAVDIAGVSRLDKRLISLGHTATRFNELMADEDLSVQVEVSWDARERRLRVVRRFEEELA